MNVVECIKKRKSVRSYAGVELAQNDILEILEAGRHAPSGKNGQPWRFYVVQEDKTLLRRIAEQTTYFPSVVYADCLIMVFLDKEQSYHYIKDVQAIGACIENMLLVAEELGIGCCWNGDIMRNEMKIRELLSLPLKYDLMAMLVLGRSGKEQSSALKKPLEELILNYV